MAQQQNTGRERMRMVRTDERGVTLRGSRLGQTTGERAVHTSREVAAKSVQAGGSLLSVIEQEYGEFAAQAVKTLAEENVKFHPEFNGDANRFAQEVIGPNWYARVLAFNELAGSYDFETVDNPDATALKEAMWIGMTESGTLYLFGPHSVFGNEERGSATGDTDGLFAFRFINDRSEGVTRTDGTKIPVQVSVSNPHHGARVYSYQEVQFEDEQGNVVGSEWRQTDDNLPAEGLLLTVKTTTPQNERKKYDTSALMFVVMKEHPENVQELFDAFGEAATVIDRQTLRFSREEEGPASTRASRRARTIVVSAQTGEGQEE